MASSSMLDPIRAASSERSRPVSWPRRHPLSSALLLLLTAALVYTLPPMARKPFAETSVWGLVVLASFIGYGSLVAWLTFPDRRIDIGLRAAWGAAALCFIGGLLACISLMKFDVAVVLVALGAALSGVALVRDGIGVERWRRFGTRIARRQPLMFGWGLLCVGVVALLYFGAVADWHVNPYDDEVAYLPFVKKLLDTGTLIEPFSLRRLSALGGQSLFLELVGVRAQPGQSHAFDHGVALILVVLLLWGYRAHGRRPSLLFLFLTTLFLLTLPNISINTASHFSGVVFFFALYRTISLVDESTVRRLVPVALLAAGACTLRQNFFIVPIAFLAATSWFLWRKTRSLREPLVLGGLSLAALLPWLVLSWRSNRTFLYPLLLGTANPSMTFTDSFTDWLHELRLVVGTAVELRPLMVLPLLIVVCALLRDDADRKPLRALLFACIVGFLATIHNLTQGEPMHLVRYVFGFTCALTLVIALAAAVARPDTRNATAAKALALVALIAQLLISGDSLYPRLERQFANIDAARMQMPQPSRADGWTYDKLQSAVPAHERMAVMLDQPYFLRFDRNPIFNLDMPGYSSLPPGLPYFRGSEAVRQYFLGLSIRYLAFVRGDYSRYQFRRASWIERLVTDQEVWRVHAPYAIDLIDNLSVLAQRCHILFEDRGMVVLDLGAT